MAGLQKQYKVPCMECEILQASIDEDALPILLVAEAKELSRLPRCWLWPCSCREYCSCAQASALRSGCWAASSPRLRRSP